MQESIAFCSACTMSSLRKSTFAISSPDDFIVIVHMTSLKAVSMAIKLSYNHPLLGVTSFVSRGSSGQSRSSIGLQQNERLETANAGFLLRCIESVSYTHLTLPTNREV